MPATVERLDRISVPASMRSRVVIGDAALDEMFGGTASPGIVRGSVVLLTGVPGCGKSTLCLRIADALSSKGGLNVLYNSCEEDVTMTKLRAERIGVASNMCVGDVGRSCDLVEFCELAEVDVLVQDSLQSLDVDLMSRNARLESAALRLVGLAKSRQSIVLIVGHVTKGGTFAGPMSIKHMVDVHMNVSGERVLTVEKNRFGPAWTQFTFDVGASGAAVSPMGAARQLSRSARSEERMREAVESARQALLCGDEVTGYCYERLGVRCSGSYWRVALASAIDELELDGLKVVEGRVDGRRSYRLEVEDA